MPRSSASVQLVEGRATVRWNLGTRPDVERVVRAVKAAGYDATPIVETGCHTEPARSSPMAAWRFTVIFGAALTLPLIIGEWVFGLGGGAAPT